MDKKEVKKIIICDRAIPVDPKKLHEDMAKEVKEMLRLVSLARASRSGDNDRAKLFHKDGSLLPEVTTDRPDAKDRSK